MRAIFLLIGVPTILLLPFWSLPFIPGTFSAASPYGFAAIGCLKLFRLKIHPKFWLYLALFASVWLTAASVGLLIYERQLHQLLIYPFALLGTIGVWALMDELGLEFVSRWVRWSIIIYCAVAAMDLLFPLFGFDSLRLSIHSVFSGKESEKFIVTMSEPSWAAMFSTFSIAWLICMRRLNITKYFKFDLLIMSFLFFSIVYSFSMTGFLVLGLSIMFFLIVRRSVFAPIAGSAALSLLAIVFYLSFQHYSRPDYTQDRVRKLHSLSELSLANLTEIDDSLFVRIGYPIAGIGLIFENPVALGIGRFSVKLADSLKGVGLDFRGKPEVEEHILKENADPRALLIRVGIDFGLIVGSAIIVWLGVQIYCAVQIMNQAILPLAAVILSILFNFSTPYFTPLLLFLGLCIHLRKEISNKSLVHAQLKAIPSANAWSRKFSSVKY